MEITVLEVQNPPSTPVLAIHAGSVRRQAKLEVNQPFVIPHPGSQSGPVEVSLFQQLGTQTLPSDNKDEAICKIPVKKLDGQSAEVQLCVRRGEAANLGKKQETDETMGVTRDYLDHHQLQQRIQSLIQDVLREQPENPYRYMVTQLRKAQSGNKPASDSKSANATKPAMVPKPPEQPKPAGNAGRGSGKKTSKEKPVFTPSANQQIEYTVERSPDQIAARFSVTNLLRMPRCKNAADNSLRRHARETSVSSMLNLIINGVKEKMVAQNVNAPQRPEARALVKASLSMSFEGASVLLSPEYNRQVNAWARYVAYRGATEMLGEERRKSLPQPIVFLDVGPSSWGSMLQTKPSKQTSA